MILDIVTYPDPRLKQPCEPVAEVTDEIRRLAADMLETMYNAPGVGLAAPQVGRNIRFIVIDVDWDGDDRSTRNPIFLVNPEIQELSGEPVTDKEACLSCPGISVPVTRQPWARVRYFDLDGEEWEIEGDGLLGRCLQHEIDHLSGILFYDRIDRNDPWKTDPEAEVY